jgi:hypothetical protein
MSAPCCPWPDSCCSVASTSSSIRRVASTSTSTSFSASPSASSCASRIARLSASLTSSLDRCCRRSPNRAGAPPPSATSISSCCEARGGFGCPRGRTSEKTCGATHLKLSSLPARKPVTRWPLCWSSREGGSDGTHCQPAQHHLETRTASSKGVGLWRLAPGSIPAPNRNL